MPLRGELVASFDVDIDGSAWGSEGRELASNLGLRGGAVQELRGCLVEHLPGLKAPLHPGPSPQKQHR